MSLLNEIKAKHFKSCFSLVSANVSITPDAFFFLFYAFLFFTPHSCFPLPACSERFNKSPRLWLISTLLWIVKVLKSKVMASRGPRLSTVVWKRIWKLGENGGGPAMLYFSLTEQVHHGNMKHSLTQAKERKHGSCIITALADFLLVFQPNSKQHVVLAPEPALGRHWAPGICIPVKKRPMFTPTTTTGLLHYRMWKFGSRSWHSGVIQDI